MSLIAEGPNGKSLIALSLTQSGAQARANRVLNNMRHERADANPSIRDQLVASLISLADVTPTDSGVTNAWDHPRQIPSGIHAGMWCISVPAQEARYHARDPLTGVSTGLPAIEWTAAQVVEDNEAWWPAPGI